MHEALHAIARRRFRNRQRTLFIGHKEIIAAERPDDARDMNHHIGILGKIFEGGAVLQVTPNLPHV